MKNKEFGLITSSFGHGFMELAFSKAYNQTPIAFSEKTTKEEFEKEVEDIYLKLSPFAPNMQKATWENKDLISQGGVSWRQQLLGKKITKKMWEDFAKIVLPVTKAKESPKFSSLSADTRKKTLFIPQKLISDNLCGVDAKSQSVPLSVFESLKENPDVLLILGQHFHKVNDKETVEKLAKDFNLYVPGMTEDHEVFGIRGVAHTKYDNLYMQLDKVVGIAGTHTWQTLTTHPQIPQIIIYNKELEPWQDICRGFRKRGQIVYDLGFDENTDWNTFTQKLKTLINKVETLSQKRDLEKAHTKHQVHSIQR